jgi:hypothetical protein
MDQPSQAAPHILLQQQIESDPSIKRKIKRKNILQTLGPREKKVSCTAVVPKPACALHGFSPLVTCGKDQRSHLDQ